MDADSWPLCILFFVSLALSAYFSATETAFAAANRIRLRNKADDGDRRAKKALGILDRFEEALTTILIGNNIVNTVAASVATVIVARIWGANSVALSTIAVTLLVFLFGEMLPKSFAKSRSESFALKNARPLSTLIKLMRPLSFAFTKLSEGLTRRFPAPEGPSFTEDELQDIMETIEDEGVLEPDQQELVHNAFEFGEISLKDVYIPMEKAVSIPVNAAEKDILSTIRDNQFSRYPVTDPKSIRVIGMLSAKSFLSMRLRGEHASLRSLLLPMKSFPPSAHIDDVMREMNQRRRHMALVVGEDGKQLGIVTMEDVLEELVGEIYDEDEARKADA